MEEVIAGPLSRLKRWMYAGGRPGRAARLLNRVSAAYSGGRLPGLRQSAVLEVRGRRTGRAVAFPVVVVPHEGERYVVSMLGDGANWVRNVRAAGGRATLRHGGRRAVRLTEVDPGLRPPILRRYLALAPGARPHIPVGRHAPLAAFARVAGRFPVFRVTAAPPDDDPDTGRVREPTGPDGRPMP